MRRADWLLLLGLFLAALLPGCAADVPADWCKVDDVIHTSYGLADGRCIDCSSFGRPIYGYPCPIGDGSPVCTLKSGGYRNCVCTSGTGTDTAGKPPSCTACTGFQDPVFNPQDGSSTCQCRAQDGFVPGSTKPCKCNTAKGYYPGPSSLKNPALSGQCTDCKEEGLAVITEGGRKVCGCKPGFGYPLQMTRWAFSFPTIEEVPLCITCAADNKKLSADGVCRCKAGYGVWPNNDGMAGPSGGGKYYCKACSGPGYKVDKDGWCRCTDGYAVDPDDHGSECVPCKGKGTIAMPRGTWITTWYSDVCRCKSGYALVDQPVTKCTKCGPKTTSDGWWGTCRCDAHRNPNTFPECDCQWGFKEAGDGTCQLSKQCKKSALTVTFWKGSQLPSSGWTGAAFPSSVLRKNPAVKVDLGVPFALTKAAEWKAAGVAPGLVSAPFAMQLSGCLCVPDTLQEDGMRPVLQLTTANAGASLLTSQPEPWGTINNASTDGVAAAESVLLGTDFNLRCQQVDVRTWAKAKPAKLPRLVLQFIVRD